MTQIHLLLLIIPHTVFTGTFKSFPSPAWSWLAQSMEQKKRNRGKAAFFKNRVWNFHSQSHPTRHNMATCRQRKALKM